MNDSERLRAIFDGITDIREEYIEETAQIPRRAKNRWFRWGVVAALVVILLTIFGAQGLTATESEVKPFFSIKVNAESEEYGYQFQPEDIYSSTLHTCGLDGICDCADHDWAWLRKRDTFSLEVWVEAPENATDRNTYVVVEYNGISVGGPGWCRPTENVKLDGVFRTPVDGKRCFDVVRGWFDTEADLTIHLYQINLNTEETCLMQSQTLHVVPVEEGGYEITVVDTYVNENVSWEGVPEQ